MSQVNCPCCKTITRLDESGYCCSCGTHVDNMVSKSVNSMLNSDDSDNNKLGLEIKSHMLWFGSESYDKFNSLLEQYEP